MFLVTIHWADVVLRLGQRLRRWANIKTAYAPLYYKKQELNMFGSKFNKNEVVYRGSETQFHMGGCLN